ncbi:MAG: DUF3849 domain-containing protein, partial [Eubacteriales bacterium]
AINNNEKDLWRESHNANIECCRAIEKAITLQFDGMRLMKNTARMVVEEFGIDRLNWVLANTVQHANWDGRFSRANKDWAAGFYIPRTSDKNIDHSSQYFINSHPAVLDGFINQARKYYDGLALFNRSHCIADSDNLDYNNKVLVLHAEILKDIYKTSSDQLFLAQSGFGCFPDTAGKKVFGQFLKDGEWTHFNRADFIGVISEINLPDWAKEKLKVLNASCENSQEDILKME